MLKRELVILTESSEGIVVPTEIPLHTEAKLTKTKRIRLLAYVNLHCVDTLKTPDGLNRYVRKSVCNKGRSFSILVQKY